MPDSVNFGLLSNPNQTNPIKGSMGGAAPMPQASPQQSGGLFGGLDLSAQGIANLKGLGNSLKSLFGSNPVSQANTALSQTLSQVPAPALTESMFGGSKPSSMQDKVQGAIQAPQAPSLPGPLNSPPLGSPIASPSLDTSKGILGRGKEPEDHALNNIQSPKDQIGAIHGAVQAAAQPDATPYSVAASYVGTGRQAHADVLEGFFQKSLGQNIDIQKTPWCAAFANSVLAATGHGQTGSLGALSFKTYGTSTKTPGQGDVVVMQRGGADSGLGHVGFFAGYSDDHSKVKVLAGNTGGQVEIKEYPLNSVVDFRTPPTAEELTSKAQGGPSNLASNTPQEGGIRPAPSKYNENSTQPQQLAPNQYEDLTRQFDKGQSYAYNSSTGKYA